jgi:hypothetical protein
VTQVGQFSTSAIEDFTHRPCPVAWFRQQSVFSPIKPVLSQRGELVLKWVRLDDFRDAKVKNSSALMLDDEEDKQYSPANRRHGKEVDGNDLPDVGSSRMSSRSAKEVA